MTDNVNITAGVGTPVASDDIGGVQYQRVKLSLGADGVGVDAAAGAGAVGTDTQRVTLASDDPAVTALQLLDNAISGAGFNITQIAGAAVALGTGVEATAVRVTVAADSTGVLSVDDNGASLTVDGTVAVAGTVAVTQSGTWDEVGINDSGNSITVDWAGTAPPIGAGVEATALRVTLPTNGTGVVKLGAGATEVGFVKIASGSIASGAIASGAVASGAVASGAFASGAIGSGAIASGAVASGAVASGAIAAGAVAAGAFVSGSVLSGALASGAVVDVTNVSMPITPATATATKTVGLGAEYRSTVPTWTNTQQGALQVGTRGSLHTELWNTDSATPVPSGSGTATGALRVELPTNGTGIVGLAAGTNGIGKLTANSGVDIGDMDVLSIIPGTAATNLGKREDDPHTSLDTGVMALGVTKAVPVALGADGDYAPPLLDASGRLWVRTHSVTGAQTIVADNAAAVTILAANSARVGASVANDSSAVLYLLVGTGTASATVYTVRMVQYGYYETPYGYTGIIQGIWASDPGDGAARVTEWI